MIKMDVIIFDATVYGEQMAQDEAQESYGPRDR